MDDSLMRFFTPDWRDGILTDEEYDAAFVRYDSHLATLRPRLPETLCRFIDDVSLHDGVITGVTLEVGGMLRLVVECGDLQAGYSDATLQYHGVSVIEAVPDLATLFNRADSEIIRDEVDVADDGRLEHRMLFAPNGELQIRFTVFDFRIKPRAGRRSRR